MAHFNQSVAVANSLGAADFGELSRAVPEPTIAASALGLLAELRSAPARWSRVFPL